MRTVADREAEWIFAIIAFIFKKIKNSKDFILKFPHPYLLAVKQVLEKVVIEEFRSIFLTMLTYYNLSRDGS